MGHTGAVLRWADDIHTLFAGYVVVALLAGLIAVLVRWGATAGHAGQTRPSTLELAFLAGGADRAYRASAASLRRARLVEVGPSSTLVATGRTPHHAPPLTVAVHRALRDGQTWSQLRADHDVIRETDALARRLRRSGWLVTPAQRRCARLASVALLLVAAGGAGALAVALARGASGSPDVTAVLILMVGATALTGRFLQQPPTVTLAAQRHLRRARHLYGHEPDRSTGSPAQWARAVALNGHGILLTSDPTFADALGTEDPPRYSFPELQTLVP